MNKAIFIDKDGTLIKNLPYNVDPEKLTFTDGACEALSFLSNLKYKIIVISNQSGIARGMFSENDLNKVYMRMKEHLSKYKVNLSDFCYCPHLPEGKIPEYAINCMCRKPKPGLIVRAALKYKISLPDSWMIGDILTDIEAGKSAGCNTILIDKGNETEWNMTPKNIPDYAVSNFSEIAEIISTYEKSGGTGGRRMIV